MNASAFAPPRLFTVAEYYRMAEVGIFKEDDRVELIEGEVVAMSPIGSRHAACVEKLSTLLRTLLRDGTVMPRVQNPIRLGDSSEPQPDLTLVRARDDFYAAAHPGPEDILLIIEVADASVMYDRHTKLPLYARFEISEVWLVDLVQNTVEVHSAVSGGRYTRVDRYDRETTVVSPAVPELLIPASDILAG